MVKTLREGIEIRNIEWKRDEIEVLNKYLFLSSKPMIYLINMSKKDYLDDNLPQEKEIIDLITENGKYETKSIKYSIEH